MWLFLTQYSSPSLRFRKELTTSLSWSLATRDGLLMKFAEFIEALQGPTWQGWHLNRSCWETSFLLMKKYNSLWDEWNKYYKIWKQKTEQPITSLTMYFSSISDQGLIALHDGKNVIYKIKCLRVGSENLLSYCFYRIHLITPWWLSQKSKELFQSVFQI